MQTRPVLPSEIICTPFKLRDNKDLNKDLKVSKDLQELMELMEIMESMVPPEIKEHLDPKENLVTLFILRSDIHYLILW